MKVAINAAIAGVVLLALAACSPPRGQDAVESMSAQEIGTISDPASKAHAEEVQAMKAHPGVASRNGDVLTLSAGGVPVVLLSDRPKHCGNCLRWTFRGVETLQSPEGVAPYAEVMAEDELGFYRYAFVEAGHGLTWFNDPPAVSPGGQFVASGNTGADPDSDAEFSITDWSTPYPHVVHDFGIGCISGKWVSERELKVTCAYPDGYSDTPATVQLFGEQWRLTTDEHRTPDGKKIKAPILFPKPVAGKASDPAELRTMGLVWPGQPAS